MQGKRTYNVRCLLPSGIFVVRLVPLPDSPNIHVGNPDALVHPPFYPLVLATLGRSPIGRTRSNIFTNNIFPRNHCELPCMIEHGLVY